MPRSTIKGPQDGAITFNEGSADVDFRVESDANTNALIVDGGHSTVGINTAAVSNRTLKLEGEGNTGASVSLNESTRGGYVEISAGSGTELYVGSELAILGSGNNNELLIYTGVSALKIDRTGAVTKPAQPAFLVKPASSQLNMTVGSANTVVFGTEIFDQNGDFASNAFTAPVTGKYQLNLDIFFTNIDSAGTELGIKFETSNREHNIFIEPDHAFASDGNHSYVMATLADMDANDTVTVKVTPVGGHTDVDVHSHTKFSGYLVC